MIKKNKHLDRRLNEIIQVKRDLQGYLAEKLAIIPNRIEIQNKDINTLRDSQKIFQELLNKILSFDISEDATTSEIADFIKNIEDTRIEYLKSNARFLELKYDNQNSENNQNIWTNLLSLSFVQLFKIGFSFTLPLIITIIIAAVIVAITYQLAF